VETTWPAEIRLGALLLREGLLTPEQLELALVEQLRCEKRLGEILVERGWVSRHGVARALAEQYELPYVELDDYEVEPDLPRVDPHLAAVPLRRLDDGRTVVAIADPTDVVARNELEATFGDGVCLVVADEAEIERRLPALAEDRHRLGERLAL